MNDYQKTYIMNTWQFFLYVFFVLILIIFLIYDFRGENTLILGVAGIMVGFLGVFQKQIVSICYRPRLQIKMVNLPIEQGMQYDLFIKNVGAIIRNLQLKVRDGEDKEWVNLKIPFSDYVDGDGITIKKISKGEESCFNIFMLYFQGGNGPFCEMRPNVNPNNQNFRFSLNSKVDYLLEIVADNIKPISFSIRIGDDVDHKVDFKNVNDIVEIVGLNIII